MKRIVFILIFGIISISSYAQLSIKGGFGQELSWLGGALEYKFSKISLGVGTGLYDPGINQIGWELFSTYYLKGNEDDYESSPYLLLGYGVFGNEASKNYSGNWNVDKTFYAIYGLGGYRWWWKRISLQLGVGYGHNLTETHENSTGFILSVSLGLKL